MIASLRSCYVCAKAYAIGDWCKGGIKTAVTVGAAMSHAPATDKRHGGTQ